MNKAEFNFRRNVERQIVTAVVEEALAQGCFMQAEYYGEEFFGPTQDKQKIIDTLMNLDAAYLHIFFTESNAKLNTFADAYILLVFGKDMGETVINDYTTNLENTSIINRANTISNAIENGTFTIALQ